MPVSSHYLHLPHFHVDGGRDLRLLYAVRFIGDFVEKLALFFLPIFLFELGASGRLQLLLQLSSFQNGMLLIGVFYFLFRLTTLVMVVPVAGLIFDRGQSVLLFLAHLVFVAQFALLVLAQDFPGLVLICAVLGGLRVAMYWPSYQSVLSKHVLRSRIGQDLSLLQVLLQLAQLAAPALGGFMAMLFGFKLLFLISLALSMVGGVVALFISNDPTQARINWRDVSAMFKEATFPKQAVAFVGRYYNDAALVIWPVYVFVLLGKIDRVGFLYSISFFLALLVSLLLGMYIDHTKSKRAYFTTGGFLSILWLLRSGVFSVWAIALVDSIDRLVANFHWLFFDTLIYKSSKSTESLVYFVSREIVISVTALLFWSFMVVCFLVSSAGWVFLFVVAAVGVLMSLQMNDGEGFKIKK